MHILSSCTVYMTAIFSLVGETIPVRICHLRVTRPNAWLMSFVLVRAIVDSVVVSCFH